MIAKVLISKPIHASSQCELVAVILVPKAKARKKKIMMYGCISKGRGLTNMFGVWAQKLI